MSNINFGNISATNLQVGDNNTQNVAMTQADRSEIVALLQSLHQQIQQAPIPEATRSEITAQILPSMQEAAKLPDPRPGLTAGIQKLSTNLEHANTAATSLGSIVSTVAKIADIVGPGIHLIAPFLAGLL